MRSKLLNITSRLLGVLIVIAVTIVNSSCSDTETTDSTKFTIYYTGMTDIGPSMTGVISSPTYKGSAPYDFAITRITLDGEPFSDSIFAIDSETGKITLLYMVHTGKGPRDFNIIDDRYIVVASQEDDRLELYTFDEEKEEIKPTGNTLDIIQPVCVAL